MLGQCWNNCGTMLGNAGRTLGQLIGMIMMRHYWDNVGTIFWDNFRDIFVTILRHILGQFLGHFLRQFLGQFLGHIRENYLPYHFFAFPPPAIPIEVDTGWGTEKSFFVAVGFLSHFGVKHYYDHVATFA